MVVNSIKVFARLKKEYKSRERFYEILRKSPKYDDVIFHKGSNEYSSSKFRFFKVFDQDTDQDFIFETVAKPVGFNGTIFAYGQTGSGKTYTMTGSTKKYQERGVIPRSLQFVFSSIEKTDEKPTLYISYMEIYNEICYDLLNPKDSKIASRLEELPRVAVLEDKKGEARLRNLSVLPVSSEEEAMRLFFFGDTNRAISETPLNEYSSRSHCIFTIYISCRADDTKTLRFSKLNLVDLAGSERVHKSNITGTVLNEAKHINLSLHFLQQVILALSESKRFHIPYRNSLMTFILKDSLAGNCLTVMLATLAVSKQNILETISTCKFAQRVSLIQTEPVINEVSDPYQEILLLKNEIQELRQQLVRRDISNLELERQPLTNMQKEECEKKMEEYLRNSEENFKIKCVPNIIQYCFSILKNKIEEVKHGHDQMEHTKLSAYKPITDLGKNLQNYQKACPEPSPNKILPTPIPIDSLLQEFMSNSENSKEINYYTKILSCTYQKATILGVTLEECQRNISYIREKLDIFANAEYSNKKIMLGQQLEYQQNIYRKSLMELKELRQETIQMEAGLAKAKARMVQRFKGWKRSIRINNCKIENPGRPKVGFEDDLSLFRNNSDSCSRLSLESDADLELHQVPPCQCIECIDRTGSLPHENLSVFKSNFPHDYELSKDALSYNSGLEEHYPNEDLILVPSNYCCELATQQNQSIKINVSSNTFLPDIGVKHEHEIKKSGLGNISEVYLPEIGNQSCCCNVKYDLTANDVTMKSQRSNNNYCKRVSIDCDYSGTSNQVFNYPSRLPTCSKYLDSTQTSRVHSNQGTQKSIQCPCNKEYCSSTITNCNHSHYIKKHCHKHVPSNNINLGNDNRFLVKYDDGDKILSLNNVSVDNDGAKENELVPAYFDTQFIPNKLDKENTTETSANNSSNKTKRLSFSSPKCQESPSSYFSVPYVNGNGEDAIRPTKIENFSITEEQVATKTSVNKEYNIFLDSDTVDFRKFIENITLTGDEEIDKEICSFYRSKMCS